MMPWLLQRYGTIVTQPLLFYFVRALKHSVPNAREHANLRLDVAERAPQVLSTSDSPLYERFLSERVACRLIHGSFDILERRVEEEITRVEKTVFLAQRSQELFAFAVHAVHVVEIAGHEDDGAVVLRSVLHQDCVRGGCCEEEFVRHALALLAESCAFLVPKTIEAAHDVTDEFAFDAGSVPSKTVVVRRHLEGEGLADEVGRCERKPLVRSLKKPFRASELTLDFGLDGVEDNEFTLDEKFS